MSAANYMKSYTVCPSGAEEIAGMAECENCTFRRNKFQPMCKALRMTGSNDRERSGRRSLCRKKLD